MATPMVRTLESRPLERIDYRTLMAVVKRVPTGKLPPEVEKHLSYELELRRREERRGEAFAYAR